jgi:hypothetical protein
MLNRRDALGSLGGWIAGLFGAKTAAAEALPAPRPPRGPSPRPLLSPEEQEAIHNRLLDHCCNLPDVPQGDDPAVHHAIISLYDFMDSADELLTRHEIESGGDCDCDYCDDLAGQLYAVKTFVAMLESQIIRGGLVFRREKVYEAHCKARKAIRRRVKETAVGDDLPEADEACALLPIEPLPKIYSGRCESCWQAEHKGAQS